MIGLILLALNLLAALFKSKGRLEAENAALRQQLVVLRRKVHGRVRLTRGDRLFLVQLYHWFPSILKVITTSAPRRWCAGIALGFAATGAGSLAQREDDHRSARSCEP